MATTKAPNRASSTVDVTKLSPKQNRVWDLLSQDKTPAEIAKVMKITVNGVYGHIRRIERAGIDVSAFRSSNGSSRKRGGRRRSASRNRNGFSPGVQRFLKNLDEEEGALKGEANDLDSTIKNARKQIEQAEEQRTHVGHALAGIGAARKRVTRK
jgi:DNA-binding CsgD family transcriptional regulator